MVFEVMKKISILLQLVIPISILLTACGTAVSTTPPAGTAGTPVNTAGLGAGGTQPPLENDLSSLTYSQAFDEMFDSVRRNYAFNGVAGRQPDWEAVYARIKPRVLAAEQAEDAQAYFLALREFTLAFKDGHVNIGGGDLQVSLFQVAIEGGYGFSVRELDDRRVIVTYLSPAGPAAQAGIQRGAEVLEFNNLPIPAAIERVSIWGAPPSTESLMRLQQSRYLLRAPAGTQAVIRIANPGEAAQTVTLTTVPENDSFAASSIFLRYDSQSPPVESRLLSSGAGYIKISSTSDDRQKIEALFKEGLADMLTGGISSLIIDMRVVVNLSPEPILPIIGLAGYFSDSGIPLGQFQYFNEATGQFEGTGDLQVVQPKPDRYQFPNILLLIGPGCSNACELEAYAMSKIPGVVVVGESVSAGVLSDVTGGQFQMPGGILLQIPTGRFVLPNGEILLEGEGLLPTVRVPINEANALSSEDIVLKTAIAIITGQ